MPVELFEAIVVEANPDSSRPGAIRVRIPELFGNKEVRTLVEPILPGWAGGAWQSSPATLFDGEDCRVLIVRSGRGTYRWIGSSQVWSTVMGASGTKSGARSANGQHTIIIDDDDGVTISSGNSVVRVKDDQVFLGSISATEQAMFGTSFLTALSGVLTEIAAIGAAASIPTTNTSLMITRIATSLSAGAPYLSTKVKVG